MKRDWAGNRRTRVDYTLDDGTTATLSRIAPGRNLECGVARVTPEVAAAVADACARTKKI